MAGEMPKMPLEIIKNRRKLDALPGGLHSGTKQAQESPRWTQDGSLVYSELRVCTVVVIVRVMV